MSRDALAHDELSAELALPRWLGLGFLASACACAMILAVFAHVDVTTEAVGAVRSPDGARTLTTQLQAAVLEVKTHPGAIVNAGDVLLSLDATEITAELKREQSLLASLELTTAAAEANAAAAHADVEAALGRKLSTLGRRLSLRKKSVKMHEDRVKRYGLLESEGAASPEEAMSAADMLLQVGDGRLALADDYATAEVALAELRQQREQVRLQRAASVSEARARVAKAEMLMQLTQLRAPRSGRVESLVVAPGEVLPSGATVARIVPLELSRTAVVFARPEDAAFLKAGLVASVEVDGLPLGEFGSVAARVTRVSSDLSTTEEVAAVLGPANAEQTMALRVELQLDDGPGWQKVKPFINSGTRVKARIKTRELRVLSLAFDFVRRQVR